jgi:hypothetical protein
MKTQDRPPPMSEMSMGGPWEAVVEVQERSPSIQKNSTAGPLGGGAGGPKALTIKAKNVDGGPPGRQ